MLTPLILLVLCHIIFAQKNPSPAEVKSKIEKVTVFLTGAQVQRTGSISIPQGKTEVIFKGISPNIDRQSIQVKGDGEFTIMSVNHQLNYLEELARREDIAKLETEKQQIIAVKQRKMAQLGIYKKEEAILEKNQIVAGQQNGISAEELIQVVDFQRKRWTELTTQQLDLNIELAKLDSSIIKLDKQLQALNKRKESATSEIVVALSAKTATDAKFELTYFVFEAGWFANYDLRVKDVSNPIGLAFKANVRQNTGEDWQNVKLVLSSGNPLTNNVSQELMPWHLSFDRPSRAATNPQTGIVGRGGIAEVRGKITDASSGEAIIGATIMVKGTSIGTISDLDGSYVLKTPTSPCAIVVTFTGYSTKEFPVNAGQINVSMEAGALLNEVVVVAYAAQKKLLPSIRLPKRIKEEKTIPIEVVESYQPTTMNFEIETPYSIKSDGKNYVVDIKTTEIPTEYQYFTAPKLDENAYLTALISDWQDLNLMDGEVNLFFEGAYLGRSLLETRIASDTLEISLGVDKAIQVKRTKIREKSIRQALGQNKIERREFEIMVKNNKPQPVKIKVEDQFPISNDKEIEVNDQYYTEPAELDKQRQIVTWSLDLSPKDERKLAIKYTVKYPKRKVLQLE